MVYFRKKLYQSLNVPIGRLEDQQGGGLMGLGRSAEITRDEVKFFKFIQRLRRKFVTVFDDVLRVQLSLKGICSVEEWAQLKQDITYDFVSDNHYYELRDADLTQNRVTLATQADPFVGKYYSQGWIRRNILRLTEEEIAKMDKEIKKEQAMAPPPLEGEQGGQFGQPGQPIPQGQPGQPMPPQPQQDQQQDSQDQSMTPDLDAEHQQAQKKYK